jgi:hypothetical protein
MSFCLNLEADIHYILLGGFAGHANDAFDKEKKTSLRKDSLKIVGFTEA